MAAYIQREGIEYLYSFDDGFDGIDEVTRLETVDNPPGQ
jgi:predicted nucleic acid-binding protein